MILSCVPALVRAQSLEELLSSRSRRAAGLRVSMHMFGSPRLSATVVKPKKLNEIFQQLASRKDIPFWLPDDGCYARAHKMAVLLETMGITSVKIFTVGRLRVDVDAKTHPRGEVLWRYHVAPAVLTYQNKQYQVMVIDPSLFNRPVPAQEWVNVQIDDPEDPPKVSYWPRFTYHDESSFAERWNLEELKGADDHLQKFLKIAADPVALQNFRDYSKKWVKGQPWALDPGIFEALFIRK